MIYKETGQYKSSYKSDHAIFPLIQDKIAFSTLMFIAFLIIPFVINSYWEKAILVPFLIFSLAKEERSFNFFSIWLNDSI